MKRKPKPKRNLALKVEDKESDSLMDEEDVNLLVRKFSKFLSRSKGKNLMRSKYKKDSDNVIISYE